MLKQPRRSLLLIGLAVLAGCATPSQPQRVGSTATVQFGIVRNVQAVTLDSNAGAGALVGGTIGLATGNSSSSRARNAIIGAGVGAAATSMAEGNRQGIAYTVEMADGSSTRIITDQREIRVGDCVAIERVRDTSNIRRVANGYCDRANAQAVSAVQSQVQAEATLCETAKQGLVDAKTQEAADLAIRRIELLCN